MWSFLSILIYFILHVSKIMITHKCQSEFLPYQHILYALVNGIETTQAPTQAYAVQFVGGNKMNHQYYIRLITKTEGLPRLCTLVLRDTHI